MTEAELLEILKGEFTLDIKNFDRYQKKESHIFIRLQNGWHNDLKVRDWSPTTKLMYILLLNLRATSRTPISHLSVTSLTPWCHLRGSKLTPSLVTLWKDGFIFIEKNRKDKIREEKNSPQETQQQKPENLFPTNPEISSSPQAGEAIFVFEEIPKQILQQYAVTERGIGTWVGRWGIDKVSANLVVASEKFEGGANNKNPHYRRNFAEFFCAWMENNEKKKKWAIQKKERETKQANEEDQWKAY